MSARITLGRMALEGLEIVLTTSTTADNTLLVMIDTDFEPDGSDGHTALQVDLNDGRIFDGRAFCQHDPIAVVCGVCECGARWSLEAGWQDK